MALNIGGSEGFTPYLKYNAKAGRFYIRPAGATEDVELMNPRLAIDMANAHAGWVCFQEGLPPEKVWDTSLVERTPRPAGTLKWKRGFEVMVYGPDKVQGRNVTIGLLEWSSSAGSTADAINKMHDAYLAGMGANPGKVPVYVGTGVIPITGAYGTNYEPRFELKSWVERVKVPAFDEHLGKQVAKPVPAASSSIQRQAPPGPTPGLPSNDPFNEVSPPPVDDFDSGVPF